MVPADSRRIPRDPRYSGYCWERHALRVPAYHRLRGDFPDPSASASRSVPQSYNPAPASTGTVWALPRSLATTGGIIVYFLFLGVLRCFSSPGSPHYLVMPRIQRGGLSHSDIPVSTAICASAGLFAAYHVLRRLREPRHPPVCPCLLPAAIARSNNPIPAPPPKGNGRTGTEAHGCIYFQLCSTL